MSQGTLAPQPPTSAQHPSPAPLLASERCEISGCGAQAFVRAVLPSGFDLLFCGHCIGEPTVGKTTLSPSEKITAARRAKLIADGAVLYSQYNEITQPAPAPADTSPAGF